MDVSELLPDDVSESGWSGLIQRMLAEIDGLLGASSTSLRLLQIKEKFGSLRSYYRLDHADPVIEEKVAGVVRLGHQALLQTCFRCGEPGVIRDLEGWIIPMCDAHAQREV